MGSGKAFVVMQVSDKDSSERKRADEITDYVLTPVLAERGLGVERADRDPTPGRITPALLRKLLEAEVVIVDLTGRNPNVYYELAVAHAFGKATIALIDNPANIAFDVKDERTIPIGPYESALTVPQAEGAKTELRRTLGVVLEEGYVPTSLVSEVASARSLDALAPENPLASELAGIRESVDELKVLMRPRIVIPPEVRADLAQARQLAQRLLDGETVYAALQAVDKTATSLSFDNWVNEEIARTDPWGGPVSREAPDPGKPQSRAVDAATARPLFQDEPPF